MKFLCHFFCFVVVSYCTSGTAIAQELPDIVLNIHSISMDPEKSMTDDAIAGLVTKSNKRIHLAKSAHTQIILSFIFDADGKTITYAELMVYDYVLINGKADFTDEDNKPAHEIFNMTLRAKGITTREAINDLFEIYCSTIAN